MKKIFIGLIIVNLTFVVSVFAGPAEDKYWEEYADRLIERGRICSEEADTTGKFNSDVFSSCMEIAGELDRELLEVVRAKDERDCDSMRERINNSKARVKSNAGNFLLGMLERQMENMACY